jgi:hypothetical protein
MTPMMIDYLTKMMNKLMAVYTACTITFDKDAFLK